MRAPRVAIVGSGPSAFYAAEELLKAGVLVDMIERLPTPFGLVRSGVAPDHPKIKAITAAFEKILAAPGLAFYGNVEVGRDLDVRELAELYDGLVLACGASADAPLGIDGEELPGSLGAGAFVGWYNGHPDHRGLAVPLGAERAVVVGNGNVALDVARLLLSPPERLAATDIAADAAAALAASRVREVHLLGRRGPVQASFTPAELRELSRLEGIAVRVAPEDLELDPACQIELDMPHADNARKTMKLLCEIAAAPPRPAARRLHLHFRAVPAALLGRGAVEGIRIARTVLEGPPARRTASPTGETFDLACGLVVRSTGFRAPPLPGVPGDARSGRVPNRDGRVTLSGRVLPGLYVTGWMKRGPSGVIGTNRPCGQETARAVIADLAGRPVRSDPGFRLDALLAGRRIAFVDREGWRRIDACERALGAEAGKPRQKLVDPAALLAAARGRAEAAAVP
ncbi:FAD-dependent oxidoreductase [Xanthobacter tagetidis]|uniref:NADP oxidoreductase n=1 Tax=Xanthobacter tagetidis TaxID=60216 RepID=A0A3L7ADP4_9HYPH|nr:FAD-dependent oxidoreductase [Xanthobacter tagetidis]MBB6305833.1 ferredoxin--NADP+ reductase [Xanthobacter tagetidis]RLP78357.1 NADP oxidoreductase [Xanthobacter tagetidis]